MVDEYYFLLLNILNYGSSRCYVWPIFLTASVVFVGILVSFDDSTTNNIKTITDNTISTTTTTFLNKQHVI